MEQKTLNSKKASEDGKRLLKKNKKAVLENLCQCIHERVKGNGGRMPHGYMNTLLEENKSAFDWLTRDIVNSSYCRFKRRMANHSDQKPVSEIHLDRETSTVVCSTLSDLSGSQQTQSASYRQNKGGRPSGSTNSSKRKRQENIITMKNDITREYSELKKRKKGRLSKGILEKIIDKHKRKWELEDVPIAASTIRQRVLRNHPVINHHHCGGHQSPLVAMDDAIVKIVLAMARIRQCLNPSSGLALVNSLIDGQPIQQQLIEWKKKYSSNDTGTVGKKYWRGFMKRNKHRIISRRGQKYELDRHNWTTYKNFHNMYKHTYHEMVEAGVAQRLPTPVWMDMHGNEVSEGDAVGCMVTHKLCHPDRCFVGDEVGGNLSMRGDGHAGGKLLLTAKGSVPYGRASHTEKRFTMIGLTALDGTPVLCVLILQGMKRDLSVETGIDITVNPVGKTDDGDTYFFNNTGTGKYFPGPPTCQFRGKTIPALVRWNESATITSEILTEMLATLDVLSIIPRDDNIKPFLLIDGHKSRLEIPFLEYINTPTDHWVVCLGVPYGTALWQVGDSKEQNGSFNIAMTRAKQDLLDFKMRKMTDEVCLKPTDLMPLINRAWNASFARKQKNQQAIADRGWCPLNYNLLTHPEIRATMTKGEKQSELLPSNDVFLPKYLLCPKQQSTELTSNDNGTATTINTLTDNSSANQLSLNFSNGMSAICLTDIVRHEQLQEARERIQNSKRDGEDLIAKLKAAKKLTAGICWKNETNRLGKSVFEVAKDNQMKKDIESARKVFIEEKTYLQLKREADTLLSSGKDLKNMSIKELRTILKSLKRNGDKALPTKKAEMIKLYEAWKEREPRSFEYDASLIDEIANDNVNDTDDENNDFNNIESV